MDKFYKNYVDENDRKAISILFENMATKKLIDFISKNGLEDIYRFSYETSNIKLSQENAPRIYHMLEEVCRLFDLDEYPDIFICYNYYDTAGIGGMNKPFIVLNAEYIKGINDEMLRGIIASEVAAIKAGHAQVEFMQWIIETISKYIPEAIVTAGIGVLLNECNKNKEYTKDRAFFLATRDFGLTIKYMLGNSVSNEILERFNLGSKTQNEYMKQMRDFQKNKERQIILSKIQNALSSEAFISVRIEKLEGFIQEVEAYV